MDTEADFDQFSDDEEEEEEITENTNDDHSLRQRTEEREDEHDHRADNTRIVAPFSQPHHHEDVLHRTAKPRVGRPPASYNVGGSLTPTTSVSSSSGQQSSSSSSSSKKKSKSKSKAGKGPRNSGGRNQLVKKVGGPCFFCKTSESTYWRNKGEHKMCNPCGIRLKKYKVWCTSCHYVPNKEEYRGLCANCGIKFSVF